ncbi:hypothetical protein COO60DRAFT_38413 [Scenedesmus sp. NREL 46B-D3]|nr:hypothetical protein COO60DRAFT_38413 [Scenedesmus sp. NREL 46B-D3]
MTGFDPVLLLIALMVATFPGSSTQQHAAIIFSNVNWCGITYLLAGPVRVLYICRPLWFSLSSEAAGLHQQEHLPRHVEGFCGSWYATRTGSRAWRSCVEVDAREFGRPYELHTCSSSCTMFQATYETQGCAQAHVVVVLAHAAAGGAVMVYGRSGSGWMQLVA